MSTASLLLGSAHEGEEAEPGGGCPSGSLRQLRERRELYSRMAARWRRLSLLVELSGLLLTLVGCLLLLGRLLETSPLLPDGALLGGVALTAASVAVQLLRRWLGAEGRSALFFAAAQTLEQAYDAIAYDTSSPAEALAREAEKALAAASSLCEPHAELTVVSIRAASELP